MRNAQTAKLLAKDIIITKKKNKRKHYNKNVYLSRLIENLTDIQQKMV